MNDINEKISAFYDGELNLTHEEIDELIKFINDNPSLLEQISMMSLTSAITGNEDLNVAPIKRNESKTFYKNFWLSNAMTAAATILLTLTIVNNDGFSRMSANSNSSNQINSAINSEEAKMVIERTDEYLTDYVMRIVNDPAFMISNEKIDLRNVGYKFNSSNGAKYYKGGENFQLRIEKNNFGRREEW